MYTEKRLELLMVGAGATDDLSGTGVHSYSYLVLSACSVDKLLASVTTVLVGTATVVLKRRPLFGSAAGETILATLVIPAGALAGRSFSQTICIVQLAVCDELVFEVTSAATSGNALYGVEVDNCPEEAGNNAEFSEV